MDNDMESRIKGLENLGVSPDTSADILSLMHALAEMTFTDDIFRLYFLIDYTDFLLCCIQSDCRSRFITEKE